MTKDMTEMGILLVLLMTRANYGFILVKVLMGQIIGWGCIKKDNLEGTERNHIKNLKTI